MRNSRCPSAPLWGWIDLPPGTCGQITARPISRPRSAMTSSGCARADVGGCEDVEDGRLTDGLGDLTVAVLGRLHYVNRAHLSQDGPGLQITLKEDRQIHVWPACTIPSLKWGASISPSFPSGHLHGFHPLPQPFPSNGCLEPLSPHQRFLRGAGSHMGHPIVCRSLSSSVSVPFKNRPQIDHVRDVGAAFSTTTRSSLGVLLDVAPCDEPTNSGPGCTSPILMTYAGRWM